MIRIIKGYMKRKPSYVSNLASIWTQAGGVVAIEFGIVGLADGSWVLGNLSEGSQWTAEGKKADN